MLCFLFISYIISCFDPIHVSQFLDSRMSFCDQPISEYSRKYYKGNNYAEIYKYGNGFPNHPPKVVDLQVRWFGKPLPYLYYALRATSSFVSSFLSPSTITSREILINSNTSLEWVIQTVNILVVRKGRRHRIWFKLD